MSSYYALGFDKALSISAEHNEGLSEFWDEAQALWQAKGLSLDVLVKEKNEEGEKKVPSILVLGRPNVGKSTLLNAILGQERHVVSEVAGTTRDPVESTYFYQGSHWNLVDTAGMRRPGRLERDVEWVAKEKLKEKARSADLAILLVDSEEGVTEVDANIAGMALDFGLSLIIALNKSDKLRGRGTEDLVSQLERSKDLKLDFVSFCPFVPISALTGKGVKELLKQVSEVLKARELRAQTSKLNEVFERKLRLHPHPPGPRGKAVRFYYMAQIGTAPPEFIVFSNVNGKEVHFSFKRYLVNTLREQFHFVGTPVKIHFKPAK